MSQDFGGSVTSDLPRTTLGQDIQQNMWGNDSILELQNEQERSVSKENVAMNLFAGHVVVQKKWTYSALFEIQNLWGNNQFLSSPCS